MLVQRVVHVTCSHFDHWLQARGPPSVTTARRGKWVTKSGHAPLASKAAVCHLRGDWSEFANTCGFPTWASQTDPCFVCYCARRNWRTLDGINMLEWSWSKKTTDMYLAVCTANECRVIVDTPTVRALIARSLEYDKDQRGAQGRS